MEMILDQVEDRTFDLVLKAFSEFGLFSTKSGEGNKGGAIHEWLRVNRDRILADGFPVRIKAEGAE
jgi:hypothetical protein